MAQADYRKICDDVGGLPIPAVENALASGARTCAISHPERLSDSQVIAFCAVLPVAGIEDLTLTNLVLNINSWVAVADACCKTRALRKLCIKDCNFSAEAGAGLLTFARALGEARLQTLTIANCRLGDDFAAGLAEGSLLQGDAFTCLRLSACGISDEGACKLGRALERVGMHSNLKTLDLCYNRIGDRGAGALASMLVSEGVESTIPLHALELEGNMISDAGALALARAAKGALALTRLNLSLNNTTDATLLALADALRFNTGTLKEVASAGVRGTDAAAAALIRAAARNNSLHLLDLRGVPLGAEGVSQLCTMLRYTACLNTLRVDVAGRDGAEAIARELPSNRSLMHLTMGGPVPEPLLTKMSEILAANTMRRTHESPAQSSPHIHAWIENATLGNNISGHSLQPQQLSYNSAGSPQPGRSRPTSPGPGYGSPRSDAGGSVRSRGTHTTSKTARTGTSYLSFQFSQMSRRTGISSSPLRLSTSLAAGGAAEKAAIIFRNHDVNQDNHLNKDEMLAALQEVGLLNGIRAKHVGRLLEHEFKKADWDKDGKISLQDFTAYYEKVAKLQTQMAREGRIKSASHGTKIPVGVENTPALKRVFKNYCKYALGQGRVYSNEGVPHMNAQQFHRLCQDAGFVEPEGRLPTTAVDVVYYRYRPVGGRRLAYKEFVEALGAIAYEAGLTFEDVMVALGCRGPIQITPEGSLRGSETGMPSGSSGLTSSGQPAHVDPFPHNLLAQGLSSIQEVPTPLSEAKPKKKKKAKAAAAKLSDVGPSHNPLFEAAIAESQQQMLANAQAQLRNEMETRLRALEMRSMSGSGLQTLDAVPGRDAGVTAASIAARLSKLEAQLSHTAVRQDESVGAAQQVASLQAMVAKLADDIAQIKRSGPVGSEEGVGSVSAEAHADLMQQVQNMSLLVGQLAGDVRTALSRSDRVSEQVAVLSLEQRKLAAQLAAGGGGNAGGLPNEESLLALEKRMAERQARIEGALMQVARQVDMLDSRVNADPL